MTRLSEDRALLDAFRRGERTALAEVYREYAQSVFALLAKGFPVESGAGRFHFKGHSEPWLLESTVQDVFVRAFSPAARAAYDGLRPYRAYLFSIARNLVIDGLRKGQLESTFLSQAQDHDADLEGRWPGDGEPAEVVSNQELATVCHAFVAALTAEERELFQLRFRDGLSIQQAALHLRLSEHQVKRGERLLKRRFFLRMKEHGYFETFRYGPEGLLRLVLTLVLA